MTLATLEPEIYREGGGGGNFTFKKGNVKNNMTTKIQQNKL